MDLLLKIYPNISSEGLLLGGCYILKMKNGDVISYDCRTDRPTKSWKLRGHGYVINPHRKIEKFANRHIYKEYSGLIYDQIETLYTVTNEDLESFHNVLLSYEQSFHKMIYGFEYSKGKETEYRYFCSPTLNVITKVKPNGYVENPTWCKASAVYNAEEELCLVGPHYTGFTWWYYPGRMYFSNVTWIEISEGNYNYAKTYLMEKEQELYSLINNMVGERLVC